MTKHYFVSYIGNMSGPTVGHCAMRVCDKNLTEIAAIIKDANKFTNTPIILCLKDLTKEEYEMLKGGTDND